MERGWWLLVAVALVALLVLSGGIPGDQSGSGRGEVEVRGLYNVSNGTQLWPYTSTAHDVETRTLPINVYVNKSPAETRDILVGDAQHWDEVDAEREGDGESYSVARWGAATGADRYAAVYADGTGSVWLGEEFQLEDGRYLGTREHIRIYGRFDGSWSAIQAHGEYWDWFRLRHTVVDLDRARDGVVRDLSTGDDVTVIERDSPPERVVLVGAALAVVAGWRRVSRNHLAAFGPGAVYLGVRSTGIALEGILAVAPPKAIVGVLYPFFLVGVPTVAYYWIRWVETDTSPVTAAVLTSLGFALALVIDGMAMGVYDPSLQLIAVRMTAATALGLIAAAGSTDGPTVGPGATLWLFAITLPLVGLV
ncbi:MAG: hypothetical protein ACQEQY_07895 [Halobacteriota archaeon]